MTPDSNTARPDASAPAKRHIEHFVADFAETPLQATDKVKEDQAPLSLWAEAWRNLRKQPLSLISAFLILVVVAVSLFPGLFSSIDPSSEACQLANSDGGPAAGHPLGYTQQGCDVYARVIYGTRSSVTVGLFTTIGVLVIGGIMGALAGYYGGWVDAVLARINDIFFALPLILGAIVVMQLPMFRANRTAWTLVLILMTFGWPQIARITRAPSSRSATRTSSPPHGPSGSPSSAPSCGTSCRTRSPRSSWWPRSRSVPSSSRNPRCPSSESGSRPA